MAQCVKDPAELPHATNAAIKKEDMKQQINETFSKLSQTGE